MSIVDPNDPAGTSGGAEPLPEGTESAPPGVRTMGIVRWVLIGLMALAAVSAWIYFAHSAHELSERADAKYVCPMHPSVVGEHPGSCPVCGMDLVPISSQGAAHHHDEDHEAGEHAMAPVPGTTTVEIGQERLQLIGVRTAPAVKESLAPTLRTVGMVAPDEGAVAVVPSRVNGWVEKVLVSQSGERVKKGQPLARIYSIELNAAQINYLNAIKWTRDWSSGQSQPGTQALEVDARQRLLLSGFTALDVAELEEKKAPLEYLAVRAPIDGYVGRRSIQVGANVTPGQELYEIADTTNVWVLADVYEADIGRVKAGQQAKVTLQALPGEVFTGKVAYLYPAVNPQSRTLQARIVVPNSKGKLRPGMYADVTFDLGTTQAVTIPADALVDTGESQYVFIALPGGRFEPRPVVVGARTAARVQILRGVEPGENVVTTANFLIDSESRLRAAIQGFGGK